MHKKLRFSIIICVLIYIIYVIVSAHPLGQEYQFVPKWKIDIENARQAETNAQELFNFKLGQALGYFTADGAVTLYKSFPFKASISDYYYADYNANAENTPFFTPDGKQAGTIQGAGFPFFDSDRIFLFLPGGNSFSMLNSDGSEKWTFRGTVPITAFDSSENGCVAGFADGSIRVFAPDGTQEYVFAPGGSNYSVVLGVAISPSGKYVASISGRDRQRFVLAQKDGGQIKILTNFFVENDNSSQKVLKFSESGKSVFYSAADIIGIVSVEGKKTETIKVPGQVISMKTEAGKLFALSKKENRYTVTFVEEFATFAGSFSFEATAAFIQIRNNMLFVGKDTSISYVQLVKD